MLGVVVNTLTVAVGSLVGLFFKRALSEKISDALMKALSLCVLYIGISGALKGSNTLVLIVSMVVGTLIGSLIDIDKLVNKLANKLQEKVKGSNVAEGFIGGSLLFCVGAMTVLGSLESGLTGDNTTLFTKSLLDLVSSCLLASTLGVGVLLSAGYVFVFQGAIVLLASVIAPLINDPYVIAEMTCVGSVMIVGLSLNMLGVTRIKLLNSLPAIFLPILLCRFM